ncbi:MAG: hypothetical protein ACTHJM_15950 [Marmoricola sp.]
MALTVHPQVKSGANWASYATLGLTLLNSITPDMLSGLGKWEPLVNGAVVILGFVLGSIASKGSAPAEPAPAEPDPAPAVDPVDVAKAIPAVAAQLAANTAPATPELVTVGSTPAA